MGCSLKEFRRIYSVDEAADRVVLNDYSKDGRAHILAYANQSNKEARKLGFRLPLYEVGRNINKDGSISSYVDVMQVNHDIFDKYIEDKQTYDQSRITEIEGILYEDPSDLSDDYTIREDNTQSLSEDLEGVSLYSFLETEEGEKREEHYPQEYSSRKESIETQLRELETLKWRYINRNEKDNLKDVNTLIEDLEGVLQDLDTEDAQNTYDSILREVDSLNSVLVFEGNTPKDYAQVARLMESNLLKKRIDDLSSFVLGRDTHGHRPDHVFRDEDGNLDGIAYFVFGDKLDPIQKSDLIVKVQDLENRFESMKSSIVSGIISNDVFVLDIMKNKPESGVAQALDKILEDVSRGTVDMDFLSKYLLGADGAGPLGQALKHKFFINEAKENGIITQDLLRMLESWEKIKDVKGYVDSKRGNKRMERVVNSLFQKDDFGVPTNNLLNSYTGRYGADRKKVNTRRKTFRSNMNETSYSSWMNEDKKVNHRIDPRLLPNVIAEYSSNPTYEKWFKFSDSEVSQYEARLRETLGETMYKRESERALAKVKEYTKSVKDNTITFMQAERRNPFEFTNNYYSDNFDKRSKFTADFLEPNYVVSIPSLGNSNYFNKEFTKVENGEHGKELMDFYSEARNLLETYINPSYRAEGIYRNPLELFTIEEVMSDVVNKSLMSFGGVSSRVKKSLVTFSSNQRGRFSNKELNDIHKIDGQERDKIEFKRMPVGYASSAKRRFIERYKGYSVNELVEVAREEGLDLTNYTEVASKLGKAPVKDGESKSLEDRIRDMMAESLSQYQVNKSTSTNLGEAILASAEMAANMNARRSTLGTLEIIKDFVNNKTKNNRGIRPTNYIDFFSVYGDQLVYGYRYSRERRNLEEGKKDIGNRPIKMLGKSYTEAERILRKEIKNQIKNRRKNGDYDFEHKGVKYYNKGQKFYKFDSETEIGDSQRAVEIEEEDINKAYKENLGAKLQDIGLSVNIKTLSLGLHENAVRAIMLGNPILGMRNRQMGLTQSLPTSSSERYGYGLNEHIKSGKLLRWSRTYYNIDKSSAKGQKLETFKSLLSRMNILQNRADEMATKGKFGSSLGVLDKASKGVFGLLVDMSLNNSEFHNQGELILNQLQVTFIEYEEGGEIKKQPVFDGDSQEFIWEPGTLTLKKKYRTPDNINMWENFQETDEGKVDSFLAIFKSKKAIEEVLGNYNNSDRATIYAGVWGDILMQYKRYLPENTKMQYGWTSADLTSGEIQKKGRKALLMEHAPTMVMYTLAMQNIVGFGVGASLGLAPLVSLAIGTLAAPAAIWWVYRKMARKQQTEAEVKMKGSFKDILLGIDMLTEGAIGGIIVPIAVATKSTSILRPLEAYKKASIKRYEKADKKYEEYLASNFIQEKDGRILLKDDHSKKPNISAADRKRLSENAMEVSRMIYIWAGYTMTALALKGLVALINVRPDDDDDLDEEAEKMLTLEEIEGLMNKVINTRNTVITDLSKYTNPVDYVDEAFSVAFGRTLSQSVNNLVNIHEAVVEGDESKEDLMYRGVQAVTPLTGMPSSFAKTLFSKEQSVHKDQWLYQGESRLDKAFGLKDNFKSETQLIKTEGAKERKRLRDNYLEEAIEYENLMRDYVTLKVDKGHSLTGGLKERYYGRSDNFTKKFAQDNILRVVKNASRPPIKDGKTDWKQAEKNVQDLLRKGIIRDHKGDEKDKIPYYIEDLKKKVENLQK